MSKKLLHNNRGLTLVGTMISAVIGLFVVMGISKTMINFAGQTAVGIQKQKLMTVSRNIDTLLRNPGMWASTISKNKSGCDFPGKPPNCPMELYRKGKRWSCSSDKNGEGIAFMTINGVLIEEIDCSKCKGDRTCGIKNVKKGNLVKVKFSYKTPPTLISAPTFKYKYEDLGITRSVSKEIEVTNSKLITVDINKIKCGIGKILTGLANDGSPICIQIQELLKQVNIVPIRKGNCPDGQVLRGYDINGSPNCTTLLAAAPPPQVVRPPAYQPPPPPTTAQCQVLGSGGKVHYSRFINRNTCDRECQTMVRYRTMAQCTWGDQIIRAYPMTDCKVTNMRGTKVRWQGRVDAAACYKRCRDLVEGAGYSNATCYRNGSVISSVGNRGWNQY
jgi:hypothetical protein